MQVFVAEKEVITTYDSKLIEKDKHSFVALKKVVELSIYKKSSGLGIKILPPNYYLKSGLSLMSKNDLVSRLKSVVLESIEGGRLKNIKILLQEGTSGSTAASKLSEEFYKEIASNLKDKLSAPVSVETSKYEKGKVQGVEINYGKEVEITVESKTTQWNY